MTDGAPNVGTPPCGDGHVVFACKKCGKTIVRPVAKIGVLVACGQCNTTNNTPGIAMQTQATAAQIARVCKVAKRASISLVLLAVVLSLLVLVVVGLAVLLEMGVLDEQTLAPLDKPAEILLTILSVFCMVLAWFLLSARRLLTGSITGMIVAHAFGYPLFLVLAVITVVRIRNQARRLNQAGPRPVE